MNDFSSHDYYCRARVDIPGLGASAPCNQPVEFTAGDDPVHVDRKVDGRHDAVPMSYGQAMRLAAGLPIHFSKHVGGSGHYVPAVPIGFYFKDGQVFRVTQPVDSPARTAEVLEPSSFSGENARWLPVSQDVLYSLKFEHSLTMIQAAEFGRKYFVCFRCGTALTLPESRARGMGRTCCKAQGWQL